MLDERGAGPECSAVVPDTAELLVGRQEGIHRSLSYATCYLLLDVNLDQVYYLCFYNK
jgi:hypothetical protein